MWGAEIVHAPGNMFYCIDSLQRGRALWGAEMRNQVHLGVPDRGFNGAAPCGARKSHITMNATQIESSFNGAAPCGARK